MRYSQFNIQMTDWSKFYTCLSEKSSYSILEWLTTKDHTSGFSNLELLFSRIPRTYGRYEQLKSKPMREMYFNRPRNCETFFTPKLRQRNGKGTPRYEPWIAKLMLRDKLNLGTAGIIKNVEVPYYSSKSSKDGNIDLVSFNEATNSLYLIELKADNSQESLIRCILEPYTYLKRITERSLERLTFEFGGNRNTRVVISPLLFNNPACNPYKEWKERNDSFLSFESLLNSELAQFLKSPGPHLEYTILDTCTYQRLLSEARQKANFAAQR